MTYPATTGENEFAVHVPVISIAAKSLDTFIATHVKEDEVTRIFNVVRSTRWTLHLYNITVAVRRLRFYLRF